MTASNGPSQSAAALPESSANEPSMDDILASIRRIIADDDALPLSRSARAAAAAQPAPIEPPAQPASDAFLGLGQRLFRGGETPPSPERPKLADKPAAFRPPAPRPPGAAAPEPTRDATRGPTLKLRDFAPPEPPAPRPSQPGATQPPEAPRRPEAPKVEAQKIEPPKIEASLRVEAAAPPPPVVAPAPLVVPAPIVTSAPVVAAAAGTTTEIKFSGGPSRPSEHIAVGAGDAARAPGVTVTLREAPLLRAGATSGAEVVPLAPVVSHLAEARLRAPERAVAGHGPNERIVAPEVGSARAEPARIETVAIEAAKVVEPVKVETITVESAPPQSAAPNPESRAGSGRVPAPPAAESRAAATAEPPLLSSASGARIGASFEALAESMMLRDPEMIERLTREMLRPMLKSWLDDNLPVVVERLVRAEIERIARGRG
jgi:uncharacterized protein